ncbi:MAG TPA: VOC family protein [Acidimicrobiia bacterium]|jgi:PhnB protein|nr:VOC family protein [Acidimicrobiia bacterium]
MPQNPPDGYHSVTPQTVVDDPRATLDFVQQVFDARVGEIYEDGEVVVHSEAVIGDSKLFIAGVKGDFGVFPVMVNVYADDVDATYAKAEQGATYLREPEDQFYSHRTAGVVDSQGNQWSITTRIGDLSAEGIR